MESDMIKNDPNEDLSTSALRNESDIIHLQGIVRI